jgi:hypothetical protein
MATDYSSVADWTQEEVEAHQRSIEESRKSYYVEIAYRTKLAGGRRSTLHSNEWRTVASGRFVYGCYSADDALYESHFWNIRGEIVAVAVSEVKR